MTDEKKYICKLCNYSTDMLGNWKKHLATKKHKSCAEKKESFDINKHFYCKCCNYSTTKSNSWQRHINSKKHISTLQRSKNKNELTHIENEAALKKEKKHVCVNCQAEFNSRTSLWRHKKTCIVEKTTTSISSNDISSLDLNSSEGKNIILEVIKQQGEIIRSMEEERSKMMDQMRSTIIGNNNNNNYININMFLNEECGNAMSIQNFAKKLQITLDDLASNNKREAISNIVIRNLKPLAITERPVHFKDKSEWYIKDEDEGWNEDNGEKLIQAASYGIQRNWSAEFEKEYPTWMQNEKLRDLYVKLAGTSSSDVTEREKLNILKEVAAACNLPKNIDEITT